jgi:hypothetical protein
VAKTCENPLAHYLWRLGAEERDPHPLFDGDWYLRQHPDVAGAGVNPLLNYLRTGSLRESAAGVRSKLGMSFPTPTNRNVKIPSCAAIAKESE